MRQKEVQKEKNDPPGTLVSLLMGFNEHFVPDRGPLCFSTLAEPWTEDRCNFFNYLYRVCCHIMHTACMINYKKEA